MTCSDKTFELIYSENWTSQEHHYKNIIKE